MSSRVLIYLLRRDLRIGDNPVLNHLATEPGHGFDFLLPVYGILPHQTEVSGFIDDGGKSPFPEARSQVGNFWRCGPHRAKFMGEAVWDLKKSLESLGSGLVVRVGKIEDVAQSLIEGLAKNGHEVGAVWMTEHEGTEEHHDEKAVAAVCANNGVEYKLWADEKYFIDDRDVGLETPQDLPDVFTLYRKSAEPLRAKPRAVLPTPGKGSLPPFPDVSIIPGQSQPFSMPESLDGLVESWTKPVRNFLPDAPGFPESAVSAHPFEGGETAALVRLSHLIQSEGMKNYKNTRNGLIGTEFSTKLSAYLAQGCLTSRQIHHALLGYEDGTDSTYEEVDGYGAGENEGTEAIRFELLWRDYMRLCHQKFKSKLFRLEGFKGDEVVYNDDEKKQKWKTAARDKAQPGQEPGPDGIADILHRFVAGTTGMGLIDASQRELLHTGYTSNRARQNVASFLTKHLSIDWRYGAEWYEMALVDYDVSSNWANWQYVAGVGNDPRGEMRIFNPVKQAFDYDKGGSYVRSWVPEVSKLEKLENVFQAWTASEDDIKAAGLDGNIMVTDPVKRIEFSVDGKPLRSNRRPFYRRRGLGRRSGSPTASEDKSADGKDGQANKRVTPDKSVQVPLGPQKLAERKSGESSRGFSRGGRGARGGSHRGQQRPYYLPGRGWPTGIGGIGMGTGPGVAGFGGHARFSHAGRVHNHWEPSLQHDG